MVSPNSPNYRNETYIQNLAELTLQNSETNQNQKAVSVSINQLPTNIILTIFKNLDCWTDLNNCHLVCKRWRDLGRNSSLNIIFLKSLFSKSPVLFIDKNTWGKTYNLQFNANYDLKETFSIITKVNSLLNKKELITVLTIPENLDSLIFSTEDSLFSIEDTLIPYFSIQKAYTVILLDSAIEESTIQELKQLGFETTGIIEDFLYNSYMSRFSISHETLNEYITDLNEDRVSENRKQLMLKL